MTHMWYIYVYSVYVCGKRGTHDVVRTYYILNSIIYSINIYIAGEYDGPGF